MLTQRGYGSSAEPCHARFVRRVENLSIVFERGDIVQELDRAEM